jgi:hypothetical protein
MDVTALIATRELSGGKQNARDKSRQLLSHVDHALAEKY